MRFMPRGDAAVLVDFERDPGRDTTAAIAALDAAIAQARIPGVIETVPGFNTLLVIIDPSTTDAADCMSALGSLSAVEASSGSLPQQWDVPVCYAEELAPDLRDVASVTGLSIGEIAAAHASVPYFVYMLGFSPGFAYLGDLPDQLVLPRRSTPRPRIEAGSVAIATRYTAVYPQATAGGWHLIGRTPMRVFDAAAQTPAAWRSGDTVRFVPVTREQYEELAARRLRLGDRW